MHVAIVWRRFLPYHAARIGALVEYLPRLGHRLSAIEVASRDLSYSFPPQRNDPLFDFTCCFPGVTYDTLSAREIHRRVLTKLSRLAPDVVFAPATPFPEGMAAIGYRINSGARMVLMDDAWEHTERRGLLVQVMKKLIHRQCDTAFVPAPSHAGYFRRMGFPAERIVFGVDAIDNDYFSSRAGVVRKKAGQLRKKHRLPENFFLFVGRFCRERGSIPC